MTIAGDRWVACVFGGDLRVYDLRREGAQDPVLVVAEGGQHALVADVLVTFDAAQGFRRFAAAAGCWQEVGRFGLPAPFVGWPGDPVLSPSGRFLCVELPAFGEERHGWVVLLDAIAGRVIASHASDLAARASFATLAGREVLFLSAPSYMGVLLVDAESGQSLRAFTPTSSWDFCHTDYALTKDEEQLLVFGCVWAAPYEVRLYDARPWTRGTKGSSEGFPLPLMFSQGEVFAGETVLAAGVADNRDQTIDVLSLVSLKELREEEEEEEAAPRDPGDRAILALLRAMPGRGALVQRRVDPRTGQVASWAAAPIAPTGETHVHALAEHVAILVGAGIQHFDGVSGELTQVAAFAEPAGWFESGVAQEGSAVVLRTLTG